MYRKACLACKVDFLIIYKPIVFCCSRSPLQKLPIVVIQKFCYHGNVTSHSSSLLLSKTCWLLYLISWKTYLISHRHFKFCKNTTMLNILTGKNNGFPFLDILGYLKNTHKNPKFGRVRQVPIRELGWEFPGWDLSYFAKFGIFMGIL